MLEVWRCPASTGTPCTPGGSQLLRGVARYGLDVSAGDVLTTAHRLLIAHYERMALAKRKLCLLAAVPVRPVTRTIILWVRH